MDKPVFKFALREDLKDDKRFLPTKAEPLASGYDVRAAMPDRKPIRIRPGQYFKIPLGFRSFCPPNWYYTMHPRSSSFLKKSMHFLYGILDEAWESESHAVGQFIPDVASLGQELVIEFGDRIAQIIPIKKPEIEIIQISNEECNFLFKERGASRKNNGFGSTGDK